MAAPISIIIPAFNELEYCRQCLGALLAHTHGDYRLILVDNGSTDGVSEFFDAVPGACVVHAGCNRGFAGGVNLGIERAEGHVLLLNSDTLVPEGWLERLARALQSADDIGIVGPMSNCVSGPQQIDGLQFIGLEEINAFADDLARRNAGKLQDITRLVGFCMLIKDRVIRELGGFDEAYGIGNFEDDDYCVRTRSAGFRLCIAEDAFVFHYGSRTFLGMGITEDKWRALIAENEQRFLRKWASAPADRCAAAEQARRQNADARAAAERGQLAEALRLYRASIETFPLLEANYNDIGVLVWRMGNRERAFEYFQRAVRLNPEYAEARDNLRDAAQALGRPPEV